MQGLDWFGHETNTPPSQSQQTNNLCSQIEPPSITTHIRSSNNNMAPNKNIIFCFDGSGQKPDDAVQPPPEQTKDDEELKNLSNVAKLHLRFGGDFKRDSSNSLYDMPGQTSLYYSGVGTYGGKIRQKLNFYFALRDVGEIIKDALEDLRKIYVPGDKIFVTGFSRGAATARLFCATVSEQKDLCDLKIELLICFDTVASIGMPDVSTQNRPKSEVVGEKREISPNVVQALHCVSIDDNRRLFQPTLMNEEDRVTEVWFAGNHKDIGGGYKDSALSDVVLKFVLDEISRRKVGLQVLSADGVKVEEISADTEETEIEDDDIAMKPNAQGTNHQEPMGLLSYHRKVVVIHDDKIVDDALPVVHYSVEERIKNTDYRPPNLVNVPHKLLQADGTQIVKSGLEDYIQPVKRLSKRAKINHNAPKAIVVRV